MMPDERVKRLVCFSTSARTLNLTRVGCTMATGTQEAQLTLASFHRAFEAPMSPHRSALTPATSTTGNETSTGNTAYQATDRPTPARFVGADVADHLLMSSRATRRLCRP
jgi:hypothetical protein